MTGMTTAKITITAKSWDESTLAETEPGRSVARAAFTTDWAGDVDGSSTCWLHIAYVAGDPGEPQTLTGPYTGFEFVTATIDGREGTFVLSVTGDHTGGVARTDVRIVDGSGTGALAGIRGAGSYAAEAMQYTMELDYDLPRGD
jgi:hypothetical protein